MTHPLHHLVPDSWFAEIFISRDVGGISDKDLIRKARELGHNVLIEGPTGSAKTTLLYAVGAEDNLPVVNVACNGGADAKELLGKLVPTPDGEFEFVAGDLVNACMYGGYVLLDEVNFLPPKIGAVLHSALDGRRVLSLIEGKGLLFKDGEPWDGEIHPDCTFVAAYNPDYAGTRPLNEAFKNRFAIKMDYGYDRTVEGELLVSPALLDWAWDLRDKGSDGSIRTPVSTNMLMEFERFVVDLGWEFATTNLFNSFRAAERAVVEELLSLRAETIKAELAKAVVVDE